MGTNRRPREEAESEKDEEIFEVVDVEDWEAAIRDVRPLSDRGEGDTRAELPEVGLAERLKRGQIPIEAQLDLHGLTQQEALDALANFLSTAIEAGQRCVLVIT